MREATVLLGALGDQRVRFEYTPDPDEPCALWITEICIGGKWINTMEFGDGVAGELIRPAERKLLERIERGFLEAA